MMEKYLLPITVKAFFRNIKNMAVRTENKSAVFAIHIFGWGKSCLDLSIENRVLLGLKFANQAQSEESSFTLPKPDVETASPSINGGLKNEVEREWLEIINKADFSNHSLSLS